MPGDHNEDTQGRVTRLLDELSGSNQTVVGELMPIVYGELRAIAKRQLRGQRAGHTINTTALVHEAYLKLVNQKEASWQNRAHFLSVAATAMRHVLINYAHRKNAEKRGGGRAAVTFEEALMSAGTAQADEIIALDEALKRLATFNERQSRVVECRFFGGLTLEEISEALGVSTATVHRDWRIARAWLTRELSTQSSIQTGKLTAGPDENLGDSPDEDVDKNGESSEGDDS